MKRKEKEESGCDRFRSRFSLCVIIFFSVCIDAFRFLGLSPFSSTIFFRLSFCILSLLSLFISCIMIIITIAIIIVILIRISICAHRDQEPWAGLKQRSLRCAQNLEQGRKSYRQWRVYTSWRSCEAAQMSLEFSNGSDILMAFKVSQIQRAGAAGVSLVYFSN